MWFHVLKPRMSRNFLGGFYQPGKPLPVFVREEIVDLYNNGLGVSEISRNKRVTKGAVHKVVQHFALHSTTQPFSCGGSEPILITDDILEVIEIWKLWTPSLYASEIRQRPLRESSCTPANVCEIFNWMIRLFETWSLSFNLVAKACQSNSFTNHSREYWNLTSPSVHAWSALTVNMLNRLVWTGYKITYFLADEILNGNTIPSSSVVIFEKKSSIAFSSTINHGC